MLQRALEAVDRLFFVGLQEEMVVSGLLLLRRMDRAEKLLHDKGGVFVKGLVSLDSEELRGEVLDLPRERSTSTTTTTTATVTYNSSSHNAPNRFIPSQGHTDSVLEGKRGPRIGRGG